MEIQEKIHGFRLMKTRRIPEADSTAYEFLHEKSGARLLFLENQDDNKVFSISFRTPPKDDTGAAHVVEHSVLCGSRKFPLKEPFVELVKGSLNTFLNAMTFPDKTMYPVASRNDKDFQNLMDVYLDAVFYPVMRQKPEVLWQEGWHYETERPEDPLTYSGVVYNEMKGATSSPEDLLETEIFKALYPDTPYHFESGGNPERIPDLTQEKFVAFHQRYYHPANSYIYLYGDLNIEEKLAFLDEAYLSHFSRIEVDSAIPRQPLFDGLRRVAKEYPVGAEEDTAAKTYLSWSLIACDAADRLTQAGMAILVHALFTTDAAPLRQALLDAGIGKDMTASLENQVAQPSLTVEVTNAEATDADRFHQVMEETLTKLVRDGIDRTLLEASLNWMEFKMREADFGTTPKGLIYNMAVMTNWLYGEEPTEPLFYEENLQKLRDGLDNGYFEDLARRCLLENPHQVLVTMAPSRTMAAAREAAVAAQLAKKKAAMAAAEIEAVIENAARLKAMQETPDTPEALAKIPLLQLADITPEMEKLSLKEREIGRIKVLLSDLPTHGIAYLNFYFDGSVLTAEDQLYAYLLCDLFGAVDTKRHSYAELTNLKNLHTGGISYDLTAIAQAEDPAQWTPKAVVKARALVRKLPELFALLEEILTASSFDDAKRLRELIDQCIAGSERQIMNMPQRVMASRLNAYLLPGAGFDDRSSLAYYRFLRDLRANFAARFKELRTRLDEVRRRLYRREGLILSVTTAEADYGAVEKAAASFLAALPAEHYPAADYTLAAPVKNEGLTNSSRVQYVGKAADFRKLGYPFTGAMRVLETIMRYGYLWNRVRVQGGAYGASAQFSREGILLFTSYRDPNLSETLAVYDEVADYLRQFTASAREMTKYIIGTISAMDTPLTPQMKGSLAAGCYLRGVTDEMRQQTRREVLTTGEAEIRALAELVEKGMKQDIYCVFGNEEKLKENRRLFSRLIPVME